MGHGSIYKKKMFRTQVQIHTHRPQYTKKICPPPKRYPGTWARVIKNQNLLEGRFLFQNHDFTRG